MGLNWLWFCLVTAAAFFVTYECTKSLLGTGGVLAAPHVAPVTHMLAASLGEIVSLAVSHPPNFFFLSLCFFPLFYSTGKLLDCCLFVLVSYILSASICRQTSCLLAFLRACFSPLCLFPTTACPKWTPPTRVTHCCLLKILRPRFNGTAGAARGQVCSLGCRLWDPAGALLSTLPALPPLAG